MTSLTDGSRVMRPPGEARLAWGRSLLGWLTVLLVIAHGGRLANQRIQLLPRSAGGPYASTDHYLSPLGKGASASIVAALDAIGPREETWYVGPDEDRGYHATIAPLSYLAWPRPFWALACRPGKVMPGGFMAKLRLDTVRPMLFFAQPPAALGPSRAFAGTLRLTNSRPDLHWTLHCSS